MNLKQFQGNLPGLHEVRPEVATFARLMEYKLRKHDGDFGKAGWKDWDYAPAMARLIDEAAELDVALKRISYTTDKYQRLVRRFEAGCEAADVANFAMMIADMAGGLNLIDHLGRPVIVCLCGSTRFSAAFRQANLQETLAGKIVLSIGCDMRSDTDIFGHMAPDELARIKTGLDELHKRKIDLADEVLILNVGGYIGDSTRSELEYAQAKGKTVRFLEPTEAQAHDHP
ncbi:MAG TPA: hypothetical protein VD973_09410 [Symbiobacteriaceae bacterium]|nr:hypothetical protein [Symbiobacteriaceae bacterium]